MIDSEVMFLGITAGILISFLIYSLYMVAKNTIEIMILESEWRTYGRIIKVLEKNKRGGRK